MDIGIWGILILLFYVFGFIAIVAVAVLSWVLWDKRFKSKQSSTAIPAGFIKTEEFFIDPTTQRKITVYYNPSNGERFYKDETEKKQS